MAGRLGLVVHVVSNGSRPIRPPGLPNVRMVVVGEGADVADDWIAERIGASDVCVTGDIPLAARCLARGARALASNGRVWTADNIGGALAGREMARHMREIGHGDRRAGAADQGRPVTVPQRAGYGGAGGAAGLTVWWFVPRLSRPRGREDRPAAPGPSVAVNNWMAGWQ